MNGVTVQLEGIEELKRALAGAAKTIRTKAVRGALREAGKVIQAEARLKAPVLRTATKTRKPGTVKRAISVRASKFARQDGNEGVFVSVRPLKAMQIRKFKASQAAAGKRFSGSQNPNDPYYWWWVEFGHNIVPRSAAAGTGTTVYQQRLVNGRIVTRKRKYNLQSITGRRRHPVGFVEGKFFMTNAAKEKGPPAIAKFMQSVVPQIQKLNERASRVR
ncbi:hypothetical protein U5817_09995 [Aromatoleum evansii]|uniref:HK97 gp10 family phage protein n=1 Tax=Aromatoleum evansii TaxID=59406 RepID=A0ABZ1AQZ2_AROEV|nr:hypothetical protein U5817_09645 [Aromatoleum evansii]WRL48358.1 hypothetical protein U5817_09995 [Aromatoleum evansii]